MYSILTKFVRLKIEKLNDAVVYATGCNYNFLLELKY